MSSPEQLMIENMTRPEKKLTGFVSLILLLVY